MLKDLLAEEDGAGAGAGDDASPPTPSPEPEPVEIDEELAMLQSALQKKGFVAAQQVVVAAPSAARPAATVPSAVTSPASAAAAKLQTRRQSTHDALRPAGSGGGRGAGQTLGEQHTAEREAAANEAGLSEEERTWVHPFCPTFFFCFLFPPFFFWREAFRSYFREKDEGAERRARERDELEEEEEWMLSVRLSVACYRLCSFFLPGAVI